MKDTPIPSTFGARVEHLRALSAPADRPNEPPSCSQVDRLAGLHRGHVWQITQGGAENPKAGTVRSLAEVFGCTVGWLLAGEGAPPTAAEVRAAFARARGASAPAGDAAADDAPATHCGRAPTEESADGPRVVREGFSQVEV